MPQGRLADLKKLESIGKAYRLLAEWGVWQIVEETKLKGASLSPGENGSLVPWSFHAKPEI